MPDYIVFRAVVPPGFNLERYSESNSEPIRFDPVTVVEAPNEREAVNTVIAATGIVGTGFAACEVVLIGFGSSNHISRGGKLQSGSPPSPRQLERDVERMSRESDEKVKRLERELDELRQLAQD